MTVYRLRATVGEGWIEAVDARGPQVVAVRADARRWDDRAQALRVLERANGFGRVQYELHTAES